MIRPPLLVIAAGACVLIAAPAASIADDRTKAVFTAAQADAGRAAYFQHCASCHMPDLSGSNDAPPLAGTNFLSAWQARTIRDLFKYMSESMPPGGAALDEKAYASIVAHILRSNGAPAGADALRPATDMSVSAIVNARPLSAPR
jgi:mono/diheme cytochrome c family protein